MSNKKNKPTAILWMSKDKTAISCEEKNKILNQNIEEIKNLAEEIIDEAILLGVDKRQIKTVLLSTISNINNNLKID